VQVSYGCLGERLYGCEVNESFVPRAQSGFDPQREIGRQERKKMAPGTGHSAKRGARVPQ